MSCNTVTNKKQICKTENKTSEKKLSH